MKARPKSKSRASGSATVSGQGSDGTASELLGSALPQLHSLSSSLADVPHAFRLLDPQGAVLHGGGPGAPDPVTARAVIHDGAGRPRGTIELTVPREGASLLAAGLAREVARGIERELAAELHLREHPRDQEAAQRLAAIVESSEDAIIGKNLDGSITSWNAGAERMYGYRPEEVVGRHISLLSAPGREYEIEDFMRWLRAGQRILHHETRRMRKDGGIIDVALTISPIRNAQGLAAILVWLGYINLPLAAFNLIPGFPMDGGRVLRAIVWWITGSGDKATTIAVRVGQVVGWLFVVWGIFRLFTGFGIGGLWVALIGWFIIQAATATLMQLKAKSVLRGMKVSDIMWRDCARLDADQDVENFVNSELVRGQQHCFLVLDRGVAVGLVSQADIRKLNRELWARTPLRAVMRPLAGVQTVAPDTPLVEALERMGRQESSELLAVSNGHLQGVVTRGAVLQVLQTMSGLKAA